MIPHQCWAAKLLARQFSASIFTVHRSNTEIAAMLSFRDTGTEAALRLRLADVGVQIH
jgi:hypothetical protein